MEFLDLLLKLWDFRNQITEHIEHLIQNEVIDHWNPSELSHQILGTVDLRASFEVNLSSQNSHSNVDLDHLEVLEVNWSESCDLRFDEVEELVSLKARL